LTGQLSPTSKPWGSTGVGTPGTLCQKELYSLQLAGDPNS